MVIHHGSRIGGNAPETQKSLNLEVLDAINRVTLRQVACVPKFPGVHSSECSGVKRLPQWDIHFSV
jgi:hypothetical protein